MDLATGKEVWRTRTDSNALSSPAVAGDVVTIGDAAGNVLGLDLATGRELWRVVTGEAVHSSPLVRDGRVYVGSNDGKLYALKGDLAAPPRRSLRAVYFDSRAPYRHFQGDRELRDALAVESYETLSRRNVAEFLEKRVADRVPSVVVFATDVIPTALVDETQPGGTLVRRYLDAGGKIVWPGNIPLFLHFDPATGQLVDPAPKDLERTKRVLDVEQNNIFEGDCRAQATEAGRRWGFPNGWWVGESPIAATPGTVEILASDEHGHAAAWVRRYGGPEGTGFVRFWGRERRLPDPRLGAGARGVRSALNRSGHGARRAVLAREILPFWRRARYSRSMEPEARPTTRASDSLEEWFLDLREAAALELAASVFGVEPARGAKG